MTDKDLERAEAYWAAARQRVMKIVRACDLQAEISDEFLFDLFDCGEYTPTDEEIIEALEEYIYE